MHPCWTIYEPPITYGSMEWRIQSIPLLGYLKQQERDCFSTRYASFLYLPMHVSARIFFKSQSLPEKSHKSGLPFFWNNPLEFKICEEHLITVLWLQNILLIIISINEVRHFAQHNCVNCIKYSRFFPHFEKIPLFLISMF